MSLTDEILFFLSNNPGNYRRLRSRLAGHYEGTFGKTRFEKKVHINEQSLRTLLSRLKKRGYVKNNKGLWFITTKGIKKFKARSSFLDYRRYSKPKRSNLAEKIIISFDIPECLKTRRTWLRKALLSLGFIMLQRSVWLGPSPLPEEFIKDLKVKGISDYLKFFAVKESDIV